MNHFPHARQTRNPRPYEGDAGFVADLDSRQRIYLLERLRRQSIALQSAMRDTATVLGIVNALHESALATINSLSNPAPQLRVARQLPKKSGKLRRRPRPPRNAAAAKLDRIRPA